MKKHNIFAAAVLALYNGITSMAGMVKKSVRTDPAAADAKARFNHNKAIEARRVAKKARKLAERQNGR